MYEVTVGQRQRRASSRLDVIAILAEELSSLVAADHGLADDVSRVNVAAGEIVAVLEDHGAWETTLHGSGAPIWVHVIVSS